jgi:hypothetical protein
MAAILERRRQRLLQRRAARRRVSDGLEVWLQSDEPTTIGTLSDSFGEKILAAACLVLMAPSALPIPTGGATHLLDIIAILFALQMVIARRTLWVPDKWRNRELGNASQKAIRGLIRFVRWCERFSRPRMAALMRSRVGESVLGLLVVVFVAAAFISPPFTGLDTLPALGVVLLALGILLEDIVFAGAGVAVGVGGVGLTIALGLQAAHTIGSLVG